ncbi:PTS transporter subunit EIIC [Salmonella enterica]|uniref:PTS transporter subunit EIIC n=1 Tax=Salmonella enterica TaxID=28901 RepID=UPI00398C5A5A
MVLGIPSLQTGVFGGILIGIIPAWLYKRHYRTQRRPLLECSSGNTFVPTVTSSSSLFLGPVMACCSRPVHTLPLRMS